MNTPANQRALIVLRPEPGLSQTMAAARAMGLTALGEALFELEPVAWAVPDPGDFDALLVGSANVFRHGGLLLSRLARLPVLCVGEATAEAAREAGFTVDFVGEGGLQALLDGHDNVPRRLLRLAGRDHVDLQLPEGVSADLRVVYAAQTLPLSRSLARRCAGGVVALHSARAAEYFANEINRIGIDRERVSLLTFGPRIAEAVGEGWAEVAIAPQPDDAALLAMARVMCQKGGGTDGAGRDRGRRN